MPRPWRVRGLAIRPSTALSLPPMVSPQQRGVFTPVPWPAWERRPGRSLLSSLASPRLGRASSTKHSSFPFGPLPLNSLIWDRYWERGASLVAKTEKNLPSMQEI